MLNPALLNRQFQQQQYQNDPDNDNINNGNMNPNLNIQNLNNKIGNEQESQTISVNYNLLQNNDIVRWNGTDLKLRSPTGLTTINKVKFRQFIGELLPYTSIQLPSLKCDIVAYVSPRMIHTSDSINNGYIYGRIDGDYNGLIENFVEPNNQTPVTLVSLNKPWTYDSSEEDQIEYNISEMLNYVNSSFTQWLSSSKLDIKYLQDNLDISTLFDIRTNIGETMEIVPYTNESTLIVYKQSGSYYDIYRVLCDENKASTANVSTIGTNAGKVIGYYTFRSSISESTSNNAVLVINENEELTQGRLYSNNGIGSKWLVYKESLKARYPYLRGWISCSPDFVSVCNYSDTVLGTHRFKCLGITETILSGSRVFDIDLSMVYETITGYTILSNTIQIFVCYCYLSNATKLTDTTQQLMLQLMVGKIGTDSNGDTRVVYDYLSLSANIDTTKATDQTVTSLVLYGTSSVISFSFNDGMLLSEYIENGFDKRDRFTSSYKRDAQYIEGSSASNIDVYGMCGDKYYYKGHKTSASSSYYTMTIQPIQIHTKVLYVNSLYIIQSTKKNQNYYNYTLATNFSGSLLKNYVTRGFITPDTTIARIDHRLSIEYDLIPIQNTYLSPTDASYLLVSKSDYSIENTALQRIIVGYQVSNLNSYLKQWIDETSANQILLNMINQLNGYPTASSDDQYFKYENGTMTYPYISYQDETKTYSAVVSFVPVFYTDPYYFKTSIVVNDTISSKSTVDLFSYDCDILTLNESVLTLLETLLLLQYEYNDLQLRCSNFPNNDNVVFSVNEICRIAFKTMQTNSNVFELSINVCDSSGNSIELETLKRLYGKLQLSVEYEQ